MLLDLRPLFAGSKASLPVAFQMELSDLEFLGVRPLKAPVQISGEIVSRAGIVESHLDCKVEYQGNCDRCFETVSKEYTFEIVRTIVQSLENDENDEITVVPDMQLDLEDFCYADIVMSFPTKLLCKDSCRGLCPDCGANLNHEQCNCSHTEVDPRLSKLAELLKDSSTKQ